MSSSKEGEFLAENGQTIVGSSKRNATVYDAVAGRVSTQRFIPDAPYTSTTRDIATSSSLPVPPDEVLFRRRRAPVRYEEDDIYWAHRHLKQDQILPDTDLLKAVHIYASEYYESALGAQGDVSFGSMDETALLAVGILLEEAAEHILGETGDLAFVEGEEISDHDGEPDVQRLGLLDPAQEPEEAEPSTDNESKDTRRHKKRKIRHPPK
ncbi:hypothetical protein G7Y79_00028g062280 [Physcia stellaris]|nr:hypothetical protein G7Y79_00028g062280 [Physcia stellaris]